MNMVKELPCGWGDTSLSSALYKDQNFKMRKNCVELFAYARVSNASSYIQVGSITKYKSMLGDAVLSMVICGC